MKIVHVVDSMDVGGAEILVSQMCHHQRQQGHDLLVCAISRLGDIGRQMQKDGFDIRTNLGSKLTEGTRNFFRLFEEIRPDVVHIHNLTPTIYAAPAARMTGASCVLSTRHSLVNPPHNVLAEFKYALAAQFCDWIVGICDATVENLRRLHSIPPRKIVRVYNGTLPMSRTAQEQWPEKTACTFLYVGRLQPVKNLSLMLNAFKLATASVPSLRLWIVGDGTERKMLQELAATLGIENNVTFWGQQLNVSPFFSAADAFVMSSRSEGLPLSLLQAFSVHCPAIVTNVGGMAEVVRGAGGGVVVPAEDAPEMAEAMLHLACNHEERAQFSRAAGIAFDAHFSLVDMVTKYQSLYRSTPRAGQARFR